MATSRNKATKPAADAAEHGGLEVDPSGALVNAVPVEVLTRIRVGREMIKVAIKDGTEFVDKPHGAPIYLDEGEDEVMTLGEAESFEKLGAVRIMITGKQRAELREELVAQRIAERQRARRAAHGPAASDDA